MASSRGVFRGVYCSLVDSLDFQRLSSPARLVFLTMRLSLQSGPVGIFRYYPEMVAEQTGYRREEVDAAVAELVTEGWVQLEDGILWLVNAFKYDPYMRWSNLFHRRAIMAWLSALPQRPIVARFRKYYGLKGHWQGSSSTSRSAGGCNRRKEQEQEQEQEREEKKHRTALAPSVPRALTDEQFLEALRLNPAYQHIDLPVELAKMDVWFLTPKGRGRKKTRSFIVNWLNRIDRPIQGTNGAVLPPGVAEAGRRFLARHEREGYQDMAQAEKSRPRGAGEPTGGVC